MADYRMMSRFRRRLHAALALAEARDRPGPRPRRRRDRLRWLCSDLIVCADGLPHALFAARVWGSPTTSIVDLPRRPGARQRLLLTGDALDGRSGGRLGAGLLQSSHPQGELEEAGLALARGVALLH